MGSEGSNTLDPTKEEGKKGESKRGRDGERERGREGERERGREGRREGASMKRGDYVLFGSGLRVELLVSICWTFSD